MSLAVASALQARKRPVIRSCDISQPGGKYFWKAEEIGLNSWTYSTESRTHIMSFVWLSNQSERNAYLAGLYAAGVSDQVYVSPMKPIPAEGAWLTLRGNGASLGPVHYGNHKTGQSSVVVGRELFLKLAAGSEDIRMIVQAQDGRVLYDESLSSADIREAEAGLVPLVRKIDEDMKDREHRCGEMIILVH